MLSARAAVTVVTLILLNFKLTTCRSSSDNGTDPAPAPKRAQPVVELPGVDASELTPREKRQWSTYVSELLAPCPDQPVSLAQCVKENRDCAACAPAARMLVEQVRRGKARPQVEAAFRARFSPSQVHSIPIEGSPSKGADDAPVVIVEWADFECPFCRQTAPVLDQLVEQYPGRVKLVFKNYPLSAHKHAEKAARAAVAAGKQGKFWKMHHALFEAQDKTLDEATIKRLAKDLGLDMAQFVEDRRSEEVADRVARDRRQADELDLQGTPMIYINGRAFDLKQFDLREDLEDWVELEIAMETGVPLESVKKGEAPAEAKAAPETVDAGAGGS